MTTRNVPAPASRMSRATECPRCTRTVREPGRVLCGVCEVSVRELVVRLVRMLGELATTAAKEDVLGRPGAGGGGSSAVSGVPLRLDAALLGAEIRAHLRTAQHMSLGDLAHMVSFWAEGWEWTERAEHLLHRAVAVVDLPTDRVLVGVCDDGTPLSAPAGAAAVQCPNCGTAWETAERQRARIAAVGQHIAPGPVIIRALGTIGVQVKPKDLENWVRLGHVTRHPGGVKVGEVWDTAERMATRRRNSKTSTISQDI